MAELARGNVTDRPWGRTFATPFLRGITGQLTVVSEGKRFLVAFEHGAVVAAASPLAADAAARVALTGHLVSSSQVPEISRRQAAAPGRDEIGVIAELARLGPDHALRLRRRVIAQRAARTFSVNHGEFVFTDRTELVIVAGCELDVRAVIYMGARTNLSEHRLSAELDQLGGWFQLKPGLDDALPQYGFGDLEQPVIERLRDGGTLHELEEFTESFVDARTVRAVVYALAVCNACELVSGEAGGMRSRASSPITAQSGPSGAADAEDPAEDTAPEIAMASSRTQPLYGVPVSAVAAPASARTTPSSDPASSVGGRAPARITPSSDPARLRPTPTPAPAATTSSVARTRTSAYPSTAPLPVVAPAATPRSEVPGARTTPAPASRVPAEPPALATGSTELLPPEEYEEPTRRHSSSAAYEAEPRRDSSGPALRYPPEEAPPPAGSTRAESGGRRSGDSDPALRQPVGGGRRRGDSDPALRQPVDRPRDPGSNRSARSPSDTGSNPALRRPDESQRGSDAGAAVRPRRASDSNPVLRPTAAEPSPQVVIRRVASSRPTPTRTVARAESAQSHEVKALIAQRLKLLDQGADHFMLLGVVQDVATDTLRKSYFALARQLHPDRLAALGISDDGKHAQRLFAQINAGFAILSDPGRRAQYLHVLQRGGEAAVREEQAAAEEMTRRILEAEEAFRRGELALRRDQPLVAVSELELAVQLHPDEADYQALLTWAQFCAAPDKAAIASKTRAQLEKVLQRAPKAVPARLYLGRVERMLGREPEALRHFRDVLAVAPGNADAAAEVRALESRPGGGDKPGGGLFGRTKR